MEQKPVKIRIEYPFLSHCLGAKHLHIFVSTHSFSFTSSVFLNKKERRKTHRAQNVSILLFFSMKSHFRFHFSRSLSFREKQKSVADLCEWLLMQLQCTFRMWSRSCFPSLIFFTLTLSVVFYNWLRNTRNVMEIMDH